PDTPAGPPAPLVRPAEPPARPAEPPARAGEARARPAAEELPLAGTIRRMDPTTTSAPNALTSASCGIHRHRPAAIPPSEATRPLAAKRRLAGSPISAERPARAAERRRAEAALCIAFLATCSRHRSLPAARNRPT